MSTQSKSRFTVHHCFEDGYMGWRLEDIFDRKERLDAEARDAAEAAETASLNSGTSS